MLKKILYYGKENNKKTVRSIIVLFLSVIFQIAPFLFIYFIIGKILNHQTVTISFIIICAVGTGISLFLQAITYCKGLGLSHEAAYGTLMNLRISLQGKMEKLPLGVIEGKGTGTYYNK